MWKNQDDNRHRIHVSIRVRQVPATHVLVLLALTYCLTLATSFTTTRLPKRIPASTSALLEKKDWTTSLFPVLPASSGAGKRSSQITTPIIKQQILSPADKGFVSQAYCQFFAGSIGALTGFCIAGFKLSIEAIREFAYGDGLIGNQFPIVFIPVMGGAAVAVLALLGTNQNGAPFPPGVRGVVQEVDQQSLGVHTSAELVQDLSDSARKASAAICTLGTGCSLGPEGPGVEIGIVASRLWAFLWPAQLDPPRGQDNDEMLRNATRIQRNRLFLACGAAAGVSSGFNAPLSGVFFALEVIQKNLPPIDLPVSNSDPTSLNGDIIPTNQDKEDSPSSTNTTIIYEFQQESLVTEAGSITPILTSSVVSALVIRILLGNELALRILEYEIPTPLRELPIYLLLGATSGLMAVVFSQTAKVAKAGFDGEIGPQPLRDAIEGLPEFAKPVVGGLTCGIVGLFYPNILFFGYETLNGLLLNNQIDTGFACALLAAKIFATAISAASGLVGGTFAPALFMGGMVGVSFHNIMVESLDVSTLDFLTSTFGSAFQIADVPAYTMVGAASFLAALFRAPLTASLLAFELTKNYDVLVPLLASAGVGTLFCDLIENRLEEAATK